MNGKTLVVVDISSMIYAGVRKDGCFIDGEIHKTVNGFKDTSVPAGGVAYIFKLIHQYIGKCDIVFCADRKPTIKLSMYPTYKENRQGSRNENADNQKDLAELILQDCGLNVLARDGYEADDIIYSICNLYKSEYDKILVYVNDADLYIVVDDNVEIMPPASNGKHITRENYERACFKKEITPYNTVTFGKFLFGCKSDFVDQLYPKSLRDAIYNDFFQPQNYELLGNKRRLRAFIEKLYPAALNQFDVIYPLDVDVEVEPTIWDEAKIKVWADKIKCYEFRNYPVSATEYDRENKRITELIKEQII